MPKDFSFDIKIQLKELANDDENAFRLIFDHYKMPFYSTAFKMTHSAEIAEDIVQDVFVTIWVKRKLIAVAKNKKSYVFKILHNCIYYHFRKVAKERKLKLKLEHEEGIIEDTIETLLFEKEKRAILENAINQLPPQQKLIYKLAKQEGLSREEISHQLNISPNTVRNHLSAAVESLRTYLKKSLSMLVWVVIWLHL